MTYIIELTGEEISKRLSMAQPLVVTIDNNSISDKTAAEIISAHSAGKHVYCTISTIPNLIAELAYYDDNNIIFSGVYNNTITSVQLARDGSSAATVSTISINTIDDDHINSLIDAKLDTRLTEIENGAY